MPTVSTPTMPESCPKNTPRTHIVLINERVYDLCWFVGAKISAGYLLSLIFADSPQCVQIAPAMFRRMLGFEGY